MQLSMDALHRLRDKENSETMPLFREYSDIQAKFFSGKNSCEAEQRFESLQRRIDTVHLEQRNSRS